MTTYAVIMDLMKKVNTYSQIINLMFPGTGNSQDGLEQDPVAISTPTPPLYLCNG